jgi:hypothetical protein
MFSTVKLAIVGGIVFAFVGAFWYVSGLQADLARSQENVRTLQDSVEKQVELIDQMQRDQEDIMAARDEMRELVNRQGEQLDDLRSKFNESADGSERDFGKIAMAKPGLVENIINKGSADAIRCMELASGAELSQEEIDDENIRSDCNIDSSP